MTAVRHPLILTEIIKINKRSSLEIQSTKIIYFLYKPFRRGTTQNFITILSTITVRNESNYKNKKLYDLISYPSSDFCYPTSDFVMPLLILNLQDIFSETCLKTYDPLKNSRVRSVSTLRDTSWGLSDLLVPWYWSSYSVIGTNVCKRRNRGPWACKSACQQGGVVTTKTERRTYRKWYNGLGSVCLACSPLTILQPIVREGSDRAYTRRNTYSKVRRCIR